jgi:hypothetical protein
MKFGKNITLKMIMNSLRQKKKNYKTDHFCNIMIKNKNLSRIYNFRKNFFFLNLNTLRLINELITFKNLLKKKKNFYIKILFFI